MKKLLTGFALLLLLTLTPAITSEAAELTPTTSKAGKTITVEATDGSKIGAVYIKWNAPVAPYEIETETGTISCGQNGFLHEFIPLEQKSTSLTILLPEQPMGKSVFLRIPMCPTMSRSGSLPVREPTL